MQSLHSLKISINFVSSCADDLNKEKNNLINLLVWHWKCMTFHLPKVNQASLLAHVGARDPAQVNGL